MTNLYNELAPKSKDRFKVFMLLAKYSSDSNHFHLFYRYVKNVDAKAWDLDLTDTRALFKLASEICKDSTEPGVRATSQAFVVKFLATYEGQDGIADVKDMAVEGVVGAIKSAVSSFTTSESLIEFSAIKQVRECSTIFRFSV